MRCAPTQRCGGCDLFSLTIILAPDGFDGFLEASKSEFPSSSL